MMIRILAGSENDAALIADAVGRKAKIAKDAGEFTNGDGQAECLILGCRQPIPTRKIELLREIERNTLWVPRILVTDPDLDSTLRLSGVRLSAIVWFAELQTKLRLEIEAVRGSVPLLRLAEEIEEATLSRTPRTAFAHSLRAATHRPVRSVDELAAAVRCSPTTLSKAFSRWQRGRTTLARFLEALVILRAKQLRSSGVSWKNVSADLGFARETLQRRSKRWTGRTLVQLERVPPDRLLTAFVEQYLRPERPGPPGDRRNG